MNSSQSFRLERARHHYENLLLSSTSVVNDFQTQDKPDTDIGGSFQWHDGEANMSSQSGPSVSPRSRPHHCASAPSAGQSSSQKIFGASASTSKKSLYHSIDRSQSPRRADAIQFGGRDLSSNSYNKDQKEDLIISLQKEVERLRGKLNFVVTTAEATLRDMQQQQEEIEQDYRGKYLRVENEMEELKRINDKLQSALEQSNKEVVIEREHLSKAVRCIDRLKGRSYAASGPSALTTSSSTSLLLQPHASKSSLNTRPTTTATTNTSRPSDFSETKSMRRLSTRTSLSPTKLNSKYQF